MARFTDKDKWQDPWFRKLNGPSKLLWFYIMDNCDNAGFYAHDEEVVCMFTGMKKEHVEGALKGLARALEGPCSDGVYWVRSFIKDQRNAPLNPENKAHQQIIRLLSTKSNGFDVSEYLNQGASKGLPSPLGIGIGIGISKKPDKKPIEPKEGFDLFWSAYPKKVAKKDAVSAFNKVKVPTDTIIERVKKLVAADWSKTELRFIPNPATWLNGERWEDETASEAEPIAWIPTLIPRFDGRAVDKNNLTSDEFKAKYGHI